MKTYKIVVLESCDDCDGHGRIYDGNGNDWECSGCEGTAYQEVEIPLSMLKDLLEMTKE